MRDITTLGVTRGRRDGRPFGICQADRGFHTFAIGQTGTGKSSLLASLIRQDIEHGRGFCLIDPHGDLAEQVAELMGERGIYWDAADPACPHGYNPLAFKGETEKRFGIARSQLDTVKMTLEGYEECNSSHYRREDTGYAVATITCEMKKL